MTTNWAAGVEIHRVRGEINRMLERVLHLPAGLERGWRPPADVLVRPSDVQVEVELPGVAADQLSVEMCGGQLTIQGTKRRIHSEPTGARFHQMERFIGSFELTVEIPQPVNPASAEATLTRGVLKISLPRLDERRRTPIAVVVHEEKESA